MSQCAKEPAGLEGLPIEKVQEALLAWYRTCRRDLPWRCTRDPYKIWLSEVMLQQTQVDTALDYYARFLERFPTLRSVAIAEVDDVLELWAGLGYYRRARDFHAAAREVVEKYDGKVPSDPKLFASLPGVGPYTKGAVLSIAFDLPLPAVDGNVQRVISRLAAVEDPVDRAVGKRRVETIASALLQRKAPGEWNQAVMELGALVCRPVGPRCTECPVQPFCKAYKEGRAAGLPRIAATGRVRQVERLVAGVLVPQGFVFIRRPESGLLAGMRDLIHLEGEPESWTLPGAREAALSAHLAGLGFTGLEWKAFCGRTNHRFSHVAWDMWVYLFTAASLPGGAYETVPIEGVAELALPTATKKALKLVLRALQG